jgi:hypothetical protein
MVGFKIHVVLNEVKNLSKRLSHQRTDHAEKRLMDMLMWKDHGFLLRSVNGTTWIWRDSLRSE